MENKKVKIVVLGSGSFGTALACVSARNGHDVVIISRSEEKANEINEKHTNTAFFDESLKLPLNVRSSINHYELKDADIIIHAIPAQMSMEAIEAFKEYLPDNVPYIVASKGILIKQKKFFSEVFADIIPKEKNLTHMCISGPSFAIEMIKEYPTIVTLASKDLEKAREVQKLINSDTFKVYTNDDVLGVEMGGALKNVIAIMAGFVEGLGFKSNTLAALITRAVLEISLFSENYGGKQQTLNGLSGIGDIILSSMGGLSRNKKVGLRLADGESIDKIVESSKELAEGIPTMQVFHEICKERKLFLPLCDTMYNVVYGGLNLNEAKGLIMKRGYENEFDLKINI